MDGMEKLKSYDGLNFFFFFFSLKAWICFMFPFFLF